MRPFFIRTAGPRDLQAISDLLRETWHATYDGIYGAARVSELTASWHSVDALKPRLGRLNSEFLVADDGERLGGMVYGAATEGNGRTVVLHQLYVRPGCQRAGIGRSLLAEIEECSRRPSGCGLRSRRPTNRRSDSTGARGSHVRDRRPIAATTHRESPPRSMKSA